MCDIEDFTDGELMDEVDRRGLDHSTVRIAYQVPKRVSDVLSDIYEKKRNNQDYDRLLDDLIYITIGRIL